MKRFIIINALIWAAVLLSTSYFMGGNENYKYVFFILVFASGLQVSLLSSLSKKSSVSSDCVNPLKKFMR